MVGMRRKRVLPDPVEPSSSTWRSGSNRYLPLVKPYAKPRALGLALPSHVTEPLTSSVPVLMRALPRTPPSSPHPFACSIEKKNSEMRKSSASVAAVPAGWAAKPPDSHQLGTAVRSKVGMVVMVPPLKR